MKNFIFTVGASNPKTGKLLDISHWTIDAKDLETADAIMIGRVENANRTIPSVRNEIIAREPFKRGVCTYFDRSLQCAGHPNVTPLKQERGGNEGEQ